MRHNSTTIDPIQKVIEGMESREEDASFCYREVAKGWGVNRTTLSRRHQGAQRARSEEARERQLLTHNRSMSLYYT
jgi:hypothetical protein